MKHAYLIMAHNTIENLVFLLKSIDDVDNDIYLHIDKKWANFDKNIVLSNVKFSNIFYVKRRKVYWGSDKIMFAEMTLFKKASKKKYDYYHLLSGQDMCIKSQKTIKNFFECNKGKEFLDFCNKSEWIKEAERRLQLYYFNSKRKIIDKLIFWIMVIQRKLKINRLKKIKIPIVGGSEWCSLSRKCVLYLIKGYRKYKKIFKHTQCCDEIYKHMIICSSDMKFDIYHNDHLKCSSALRLIDWSENKNSPKTFTMTDFESIKQSDALFARKFDVRVDNQLQQKVLDYIQEGCQSNR